MSKKFQKVTPQPNSARARVVTLPSGAEITRDLSNKRAGWIVCPDCKVERYATIPPEGSQKFRDSTWRCDACAGKRRRERTLQRCGQFVTLADGTQARRDSEDPGYVWVVCPDCPKDEVKPRKKIIPSKGSQAFLNVKSRCPKCSGQYRKQLKGKHKHIPSGAIYDYDDPDPAHPNDKSAFVCANRANHKPNTAYPKKNYARNFQFKTESWDGLCRICVKSVPGRGFKWRLNTTKNVIVCDWPEKGDQLGSPIAEILYSQVDNDDTSTVPVRFLSCPKVESCVEHWPRQSLAARLSAHKRLKEHFPSVCRYHRLNPRQLLQAMVGNGNGQKNGSTEKQLEKKPVGAPKGSRAKITERGLQNAFAQLGSHIGQEKVAEFLDVSERAVRKWQQARGLTWVQVQERFSQTGTKLSAI